MSATTATIIVVCRGRDPAIVQRSLSSIARQWSENYEGLFVDYGSVEAQKREYEQIVRQLGVFKYVYNDTLGKSWCKGHAINTGLRIASGEYIVSIDVDLIVGKGVLASALQHADSRVFLSARFRKLPRGFRKWNRLDEQKALKRSELNASGAFQIYPREPAVAIRGLDEKYEFWGLEDVDFTERLKQLGLRHVWIEPGEIYHQWHPPTELTHMPSGYWLQANLYFGVMRSMPLRNSDNWGQLWSSEMRVSAEPKPSEIWRCLLLPLKQAKIGWLPLQVAAPRIFDMAYYIRSIGLALASSPPGAVIVCRMQLPRRRKLDYLLFWVLRFGRRSWQNELEWDAPKLLEQAGWYIGASGSLCDDFRVARHADELILILKKSSKDGV